MNGPALKYPSVAQLTQLLESRGTMYNAPWSVEAESPPASPVSSRPSSPTGFSSNNRLRKMLEQSYKAVGKYVPASRRANRRKGRVAYRKGRRAATRKGRVAYRKSRRANRRTLRRRANRRLSRRRSN